VNAVTQCNRILPLDRRSPRLLPMLRRFLSVRASAVSALVFGATILPVAAQPKGYNYDEAKVPKYSLPDPLINGDGKSVKDAGAWQGQRREEILRLFEQYVYGRAPKGDGNVRFEVLSRYRNAFGGKATRKEVRAHFTGNGKRAHMDILIYLPNVTSGPVPLFVGLSFYGNHTVSSDPSIRLNENWMRSSSKNGIVDHRATDASRGTSASRWAIEKILDRGYGLATMYCGDIDPDFDDEFQNGIHPLFLKPGQTKPAPDEWGTIAAWSWGLSRAMDYFETDGDIDHDRVAVMGHSRLGKTSLWAGATDQRFAIVISNNSGCGGAALARRHFGETVQRINTSFPHWFNDNHVKFNEKENELPVDQHMLIALMAPRPVYIASAELDQWADPNGEFTSGKLAGPVYALFDRGGVGVAIKPGLNKPVGDFVGYHHRTGKHDVTDYDWEQYLTFADRHFGRQ